MALRVPSAGARSIHWMLASAAIAMLLLSGATGAQTGKTKVSKLKAPVVSPVAKPAPKTVQSPQIVIPQQQDVEAAAYSALVDNVSESLDQFADDNVSGNEARDHLGESDTEASADDDESGTEEKPRR